MFALRPMGGASVTRLDRWVATLDGDWRPDADALRAYRDWLEPPNHHLLLADDGAYPSRLRELPEPPAALWVWGDPARLEDPQLAVVGSRNATGSGLATATAFAAALADSGLTITSGLALGIDGAAHRGALKTGFSVAVLGSGLMNIYPPDHRELAEEVAARGAVISEYPPSAAARRHRFPQRNRILAALSVGTLVVEATISSGALITARLAGELGRDVFAIPGSIHNPMARGCHQLIRQGAVLVERADDVLGELRQALLPFVNLPSGPGARQDKPAPNLERDPSYGQLTDALGFDPQTVQQLTDATGLTSAEVSSMLLILELEGFVEALPGGRYSRLS